MAHTILLGVLFLLFIFPFGVSAQDIDAHFTTICREKGVAKPLALAIANTESGMNPLAINVAGKTYSPATREEAERIIQAAHQAGKSYDVGLMQVNSFWTKKWGITPKTLLDPETNIRTGVTILADAINRHGYTWLAVGHYHSPGEERGRQYAWSVYKKATGSKAQATAHKPIQKSKQPRGSSYAKQKTSPKSLLDARGVWRNPEQRQQGRRITFDIR